MYAISVIETDEAQNGCHRHAESKGLLRGQTWTSAVESDSPGNRDDHNWWVSLTTEGGTSIVLSTAHENMKPGTMSLYFASPDIAAAHKELSTKGARANEVKDDLYGPGSGVKWFNVDDPDGNQVFLVQA